MFELIHALSIESEAGRATGEAFVPVDLPMLADHFPGRPLVPGSWLIELAAQVAGPLAEAVIQRRHGLDRWALLGMIRHAKFLEPASVPAALRLTAEVHSDAPSNVRLKVEARQGDRLLLRGEVVMMMVEAAPPWEAAIKARHERLRRWRTPL